MNLFILTVIVCFVVFAPSSATNQRMVCEPVEDVCSADGVLRSPIQQARPGKRGPKGDRGLQGIKGDRGDEGIVDYSSVNDTVDEAVATATAKLQAKVEKLESEIRNLTNLFSNLDKSALQANLAASETTTMISTSASMTTTSPTYSGDCTDGIIYGVKCYFVKVQSVSSRSHGEQICGTFSANLGCLENVYHETLIMNYMREKIPDRKSAIWVWTALRYERSTGTMRLSNGRSLSASTLRWHPRFPSGSSTGIGLQVFSDASHSDQGIYNYPDSRSAEGVLCEK